MSAPNQYSHNRKWKEDVEAACARLCLCAILPDKWAANARITTICTHGVKNTTTVYRLAERQFCCKSQASKAHNPAMKSRAAKVAWDKHRDLMLQRQRERWSRPGEKEKHSQTCLDAHEKLREEGWINPGWGWKPSDTERLLPGTLYLIRYLDEDGTHFKIGITKLTLAERFNKGQLISILALHTATLGECFDLEQSLLRWAKDNGHRYSSHSTTELLHAAAIPHILATLRQ